MDFSFTPDPCLDYPEASQCPYGDVGFDITIPPPLTFIPEEFDDESEIVTARAEIHLQNYERKKFMREGAADQITAHSLSGDEIIQQLLDSNKVLLPLPIDHLGRWGPIFHNFILHHTPTQDIALPRTRLAAKAMLTRATNFPCPSGILHTATSCWRASNPTNRFYGFSHTAPTPVQYALQNFGLVITKSFGIHIRLASTRIGIRPPSTYRHQSFHAPTQQNYTPQTQTPPSLSRTSFQRATPIQPPVTPPMDDHYHLFTETQTYAATQTSFRSS